MTEPWSYEVFAHSFNWWKSQEICSALGYGEHLISHHQYGKRSYFTVEGPKGSRPFDFSVSSNETLCKKSKTLCGNIACPRSLNG
jgi:hypothetical protein